MSSSISMKQHGRAHARVDKSAGSSARRRPSGPISRPCVTISAKAGPAEVISSPSATMLRVAGLQVGIAPDIARPWGARREAESPTAARGDCRGCGSRERERMPPVAGVDPDLDVLVAERGLLGHRLAGRLLAAEQAGEPSRRWSAAACVGVRLAGLIQAKPIEGNFHDAHRLRLPRCWLASTGPPTAGDAGAGREFEAGLAREAERIADQEAWCDGLIVAWQNAANWPAVC